VRYFPEAIIATATKTVKIWNFTFPLELMWFLGRDHRSRRPDLRIDFGRPVDTDHGAVRGKA